MVLNIKGTVNKYYVQMLCMVFFPGEKFSPTEIETDATPVLDLEVTDEETGVRAFAVVRIAKESCGSEKFVEYTETYSADRTKKLAIGSAILSAAGKLTGYRPSWGMLIGVRPSKVATEMLLSGMSKTKTRKTLSADYQVIPKKAALATEVALNEMKIIGTPDSRDCSVYISIPFCPSRCSYCSFVSYTSQRLLSLIPDYLVRLCREIEDTFKTISHLGLRVKTVYIGGGTPTILTFEQLNFLLETVCRMTDVTKLEEFTLEAGRPDTITLEKLITAKKHGVTRISVNAQSLCEEVLHEIGRAHSAEDFFRAFDMARQAEISCINTDLIVGLPKDSFSTFSYTMDNILALRPENITVHTFCVKRSADILKNGKGIYSVRGGDAGKCVDYAQIKSLQHGYNSYYMYRQKNTVGNLENVGFSLEGYEGLYNIYMMEEVHSIFAVGAGAVTKLVKYVPAGEGSTEMERIFNPKYPYEYLKDNKNEEMRQRTVEFYRNHF